MDTPKRREMNFRVYLFACVRFYSTSMDSRANSLARDDLDVDPVALWTGQLPVGGIVGFEASHALQLSGHAWKFSFACSAIVPLAMISQ